MPCDAIANCRKGVVFAGDRSETLASTLADWGQPFAQTDFVQVTPSDLAHLLSPSDAAPINWRQAINWLRQGQFDAAVILTAPGQSPYTLAYLCYLAGIPVRVGRSQEFGGQVLTHCLPPETRNPKPDTRNLTPETQNPAPKT